MNVVLDDKELIRKFINDNLARTKQMKEVQNQENLIMNGVIDSLGIVQLVAYIEETFKMKVKDEDIVPDNFETVDVISSFVGRTR